METNTQRQRLTHLATGDAKTVETGCFMCFAASTDERRLRAATGGVAEVRGAGAGWGEVGETVLELSIRFASLNNKKNEV